jgi:hypothetical protein
MEMFLRHTVGASSPFDPDPQSRAPEPHRQQAYQTPTPVVMSATLAPDQRALTARFVGAPAGTGMCTADYSLQLTESATAVGATVTQSDYRWPPPPGRGCLTVGYVRTASGVLKAALGARVVVDAVSGRAVAVNREP